ncbi:hypothetical protein D7D52_14275 [Nocardia yunnanensis]|uniref:DUF2530 domain-containing protein n=1 Tax=Nocardia yunnanensis TaxID=2382165 RepID=A0A386ZAZ2_9NOCA|nr:hypothetical protein [Nocardia yunnanensis]AYF74841.1 hypothetical protein D7D52_14275 [Nocardia yunnanensis]
MPDSRVLPAPSEVLSTPRSDTPDTVLDGVDWPGPTLLLAAVLILAWTVSGAADGRLLGGSLATLVTLLTGLVWITLEHLRFRARDRVGR